MNMDQQPTRRWWWAASLLTGLGIAVSAYLLARTFALIAPAGHVPPDLCSVLFTASCDATLSDGRAWVLGIPLAGWGLVYFSMLAATLALARFVAGAFEAHALLAASALAAVGLCCGLVLTAGVLVRSEPICPLCISVHTLSLALVFVLHRAVARSWRETLAFVRDAWRGLSASASETSRWRLVGFGCVALVAAIAYQWVFVEAALRRPTAEQPANRAAIISAYVTSPKRTLPVSENDPHRGPLTAPVKLVVFESFQCPHCQEFAAALPRLEREFGDRLLVVFKHYPLSTRCNDRLNKDMQPDACEIAWAAEAAHRQERFWPFHDAMLAAGKGASAGAIERAAQGAGLEAARFEADRHSAAVRERVAEDIELGNELKLPGTPAVYLDGRLVRPASAEVLEILIRHELVRHEIVPRGIRPRTTESSASQTGPPRHGRGPTTEG